MAKTTSKQQSSQLKKLLLVGVGLAVIIFVAFPSGAPAPTGPKKAPVFGNPVASTKKTDPYDTPADRKAKFEPIAATIKNGFVPLVVKGGGKLTSKNGLKSTFTGGEGSWIYTGNMIVDGVPNALLENGTSGEGVFLRPGQHWKNLRLVAVKEDSIEVEGPNHEMQTVFFDDKSLNSSNSSAGPALQSLPPASIQGNIPAGPNPQLPGNGRRTRQNQQANQQANQDNSNGFVGTIGN